MESRVKMINSLSKTDDSTKTHKNIDKKTHYFKTEFIKISIKIQYFTKTYKNNDKNIHIVNLEILKVKTWFGDKDLFS